ncbi:MAG: lysophospholipid acyltransferase family protein [Flavobacteriales bacterium]|nr:lysophospholipid acyltransferase family protein [Flavobacteriales bacterium]
MDILWRILNPFQLFILAIWSAVCATSGILLVPLLLSRKRAIYVCSRIMWSPVVMIVSGVLIKVSGRENAPRDRACIYIANHESQFDIAALVRSVPVPLFFIAKQELRKVPFLGWYMRAVGMIFVDRGNKENALLSMKRAAKIIREGRNVISFPEGTRSKTGDMLLFKKGSFIIAREGGIDIVPIGISGAREVLPSGSFKLRPGIIRVQIGKPISVKDHRHLSDEQMAEFARTEVGRLR